MYFGKSFCWFPFGSKKKHFSVSNSTSWRSSETQPSHVIVGSPETVISNCLPLIPYLRTVLRLLVYGRGSEIHGTLSDLSRCTHNPRVARRPRSPHSHALMRT